MGIRLDMKVFTPNPLRAPRALRLIKNKTAKGAKNAEFLAISASLFYKEGYGGRR